MRFAPILLLCIATTIALPLSLVGAADTLFIDETIDTHRWGHFLEYLEDPDGLMDHTAAESAVRYLPVGATTFSKGYSDSAFWLRGRVADSSGKPRRIYVVLKEPSMQRADLWIDGERHPGGALEPVQNRNLGAQTSVYTFDLKAGETKTIHIRIKSRTAVNASFLVFGERGYAAWKQRMDALSFMGFGALAFAFLFNVGIALALRSRTYFAYAGFILTMIINRAAGMGYLQYFLLPEAGYAAYLAMVLSITLFSVCMLAFNISFLQTRSRFPLLHRAHQAAFLWAAVNAALCCIDPRLSDRSALILMQAISLLSVVSGIKALMRGQGSARYYLLAWAFLFVQALTFPLGVFCVIEFDLYGDEAALLTTALMTVLMSFALADNVRAIRRDKEAAQEREQRLRLASVTDELTGLFNRRHFNECLPLMVEAAERQGKALALLMLDVDRFKDFNDRWGHPAGDRVLEELGAVMRGSMREEDVPCRYGGEEFAVVLHDADEDTARDIAERIRHRFARIEFEPVPGCRARSTVSVGAVRLDRGESAASLIDRCDRALYSAKESGRNKVFIR